VFVVNSISETVDQIIANPEGGTAHLVGRDLPTTGYFVGGAGAGLVFPPTASVDRYMLTQMMLRASSEFVGWWTDPETGRLHVDQVTHEVTYIGAEVACRDRREIAFYDIERGRSWTPVLV
jgi:hypothetical protein